jgi:hypothetical protein
MKEDAHLRKALPVRCRSGERSFRAAASGVGSDVEGKASASLAGDAGSSCCDDRVALSFRLRLTPKSRRALSTGGSSLTPSRVAPDSWELDLPLLAILRNFCRATQQGGVGPSGIWCSSSPGPGVMCKCLSADTPCQRRSTPYYSAYFHLFSALLGSMSPTVWLQLSSSGLPSGTRQTRGKGNHLLLVAVTRFHTRKKTAVHTTL